jgi:hypothetical protein
MNYLGEEVKRSGHLHQLFPFCPVPFCLSREIGVAPIVATQTCGADSKGISKFYQSYILKLRDDFKILTMGPV